MKVFGWLADREGCGTYRLGMPLMALREQYDDMDTIADTTILLEDTRDCDVIIGQRTVKWASSVWWQGNALDGRCLVYELDDDLWNLHETNIGAGEWNDPERQKVLTRNVEVAAAVTVSTPALADVVSKINPRVHVLPNYVDEALLHVERHRRDQLTIGWSGSATHLIDFKRAQDPLTRYFRKYPASGMHFMGADYSPMIRKQSRATGWTKGVAAFHRTIDFDIGIAPLADIRFNHSKSAVRALEYAALGIPVVASDVGPYREFIEHGVTGFLCRDDHDWFRYLRMLTEDVDLRETMGAAARAQAAGHTIQGNAWRWREAYEQIVSQTGASKPALPYFDLKMPV